MFKASKGDNFGEKHPGDNQQAREDRALSGRDEMFLFLLEAARQQELEKQTEIGKAPPPSLDRLELINKKIEIVKKIVSERDPAIQTKLREELDKLDGGLDHMAAWEFGEDFNQKHPELLPGEKFYGNIPSDQLSLFASYPFTSKRLGDKAYYRHGTLLESCRPVFVAQSELENLSIGNKKRGKESEKTKWIN